MSSVIILGLILSLIFGVIAYFSSCSYLIAGITLVLTLLYFLFILDRRFKKHNLKINRFHQCYSFINNFLISLSIKESILGAFESACEGMGDDFNEELDAMADFNEMEKVSYLHHYFPFHLYRLFIDLVSLWSEQGGDVIEMSNHLLNEAREIEDYLMFSQRENKKALAEFGVLWGFSLSILFILRFVLNDFYDSIIKQSFYPYSVLAIFIFLLISIEILSWKMTNVNLRGWTNGTK